MFEQSTLASGSVSKRFWTTGAGVAGQAALVGFMLLAPMVWPQVLPRAMFITMITTPGPPPPPPPKGAAVVRPRAAVRNTHPLMDAFMEPSQIPAHVQRIVDPAPELSEPGVPGGVRDGAPGGVPGCIVSEILSSVRLPAEVPRTPEPVRAARAPETVVQPPQRIRVSDLHTARLVHRVEPVYPALARQNRVQGVVQLEGIIGTDGHLREVRVLSGHPFLAKAALEAVSQWVYEPTHLGGKPVEVIAPITVTFKLN